MSKKLTILSLPLIMGIIIGIMISGVASGATEDPVDESLLPDVEAIYHTSLNQPFQTAGAEIDDPDIEAYYSALISNCGLGTSEDTER